VATDDQINEQLRLDKDLRDKVVSLLTHQAIYEEDVSKSLTGLAKEEEGLASRLAELSSTQSRDKQGLYRMLLFSSTLDSDVSILEDTLTSLSTGRAPARLSSYLSFKSGLDQVYSFGLSTIVRVPGGLDVQYVTSLYQEVEVIQTLAHPSYLDLRTERALYHLHPSHFDSPLDVAEVLSCSFYVSESSCDLPCTFTKFYFLFNFR